jgi:phosphocarrier protein
VELPVESLNRTLTILNPKGLHVRAATVLATTLKAFDAEVTLTHGDQSANAKSVMHLLLLTAAKGARVEATASGPQAQEALEATAHVIEDGFGEGD